MSRRLPLFTLRASVRTVLAEAGDKGATLADIEAATGADRHSIQRALGGAREKFSAPITSKLWPLCMACWASWSICAAWSW